MVKKILLIILIIIVLFFVVRNIDFKDTLQITQNDSTAVFVPSVNDFVQHKISQDSLLTWYGENKIQVKSHTGTLLFDTDVSFVGFAPKNEAGDLEVVGGQILVDMSSLAAQNEPEMMVNHLRSADFFDVETYPVADFLITGKSDGQVKGMLTIKNTTQEVLVPYTLTQEQDGRYKLEGVFEIDRTLWNITTLSKTFFEDVGDAVVEDIMRISFVIYTEN